MNIFIAGELSTTCLKYKAVPISFVYYFLLFRQFISYWFETNFLNIQPPFHEWNTLLNSVLVVPDSGKDMLYLIDKTSLFTYHIPRNDFHKFYMQTRPQYNL